MSGEFRFDGYVMACCGRVIAGATSAPDPDDHDCRAFGGLAAHARERIAADKVHRARREAAPRERP